MRRQRLPVQARRRQRRQRLVGATAPTTTSPHDWHDRAFRQRDIAFAWGPTADRSLRRTAVIEFVIASGSGAGKGSACFDHLVLRRAAEPALARRAARRSATSTVRWPPGAGPSRYDLQFSDDGAAWRTVRHVERARGDVQHHLFVRARKRARCGCWPSRSRAAIELGDAADRERVLHPHRRAGRRAAATRAPMSASSPTGPSSASTARASPR